MEALREVQVRMAVEAIEARALSEATRSELRSTATANKRRHESRESARQRKAERIVERDMRDYRSKTAVKERQRVVSLLLCVLRTNFKRKY
jgi:cell division septum initiation protein DivIVA